MTSVCREAQRQLDEIDRALKAVDRTFNVMGFFLPQVRLMYGLGKMLHELTPDSDYIIELKKAARGERSTLPEPPPSDITGCFTAGCM